MKIIHCADLHLDSKLTANLDKEKAKQRKQELLLTFKRMVSYAADNGIEAILICGDLFDTKVISATARNTVLSEIVNHPDIDFYYLKGNHDSDNFLSSEEDIPDNLKLFGDTWTEYDLSPDGKVKLYGIEFNGANTASAQVNFVPDPSDINIVMLHGQESESSAKDKAEIIDLKAFRNKGINYLALGHIHEYKCDMLDGEGKYCYPGCLEGRGFDECGEHGFVELNVDTESGKISDRFVSFALRKLYEINVDITGLNVSPDIILRAKNVLSSSDATDEDLVKVVL
ncbi:MAG: metallophosphoesterase, partial [Lachnospiraceae bacterium]|nr:metallophosphoesterase [Lachnospiraceae bacterium]